MPEAIRTLSEIRLSRLTRDRLLRQWFERNEPDADAPIAASSPATILGGAAAALVLA